MDVSLRVRFTTTERRERGAAHRVSIAPAQPEMTDPGPVTPYVPAAPTPEMAKRVGSASSAVAAQQ